jgi:two-component system phosphate regulon sensor histidine kinase PhoR
LNTLVSSLHEGLIVIDKNGKIAQRNKSFEKIVRGDLVDEKFYWEVLREPKFAELIRKTTDRKRNVVEEIPLGQRIFLCSATFLEAREQVVVIFHDITEMKDLEKMKRDFVTNVSHELRTPLTAIKGFAETLEDVGESNQHYVDIIKNHTDRLSNIVNDLLLLSELEERGTELQIEPVNVRSVVEDILKIFEQRLREKGLNLTLQADDNLAPIEADPFRLQQVFANLIDNAIKYTEKGEITIWLKQEERMLVIEIQDTGTGIPEGHLPRIFERFYVVDKARSKRLGGTGLGLSIVRHIVLLHNGKIDVESSPGVGTRFTITLPVITP